MQSPPSIQVDAVAVEQVDQLAALAEEIWRECYAELLSKQQIDYMLDMMYAPQRLRYEINDGGIEYFWLAPALVRGEGAGCAPRGFLAFGPSDGQPDEIFLHKIYLHADCRGLGLGAAALAWLEEQGRKQARGFSKIQLRVNRGNHPAIRAYQKAGFEITEQVCSDIGGGFVMDDFVMVLQI